ERYLQSLYVVARRAVFKCPRAGRVGGDVTAEKTTSFGRIGRIEHAARFDGVLQVAQEHSRLSAGSGVLDTDYSIESIQREHSAAKRHAPTDGAGARSGNCDGC